MIKTFSICILLIYFCIITSSCARKFKVYDNSLPREIGALAEVTYSSNAERILCYSTIILYGGYCWYIAFGDSNIDDLKNIKDYSNRYLKRNKKYFIVRRNKNIAFFDFKNNVEILRNKKEIKRIIDSELSKKTITITEKDICYILLDNKTNFPSDLLNNMTISMISKYVRPVKKIPPSGLDAKQKCVYEVMYEKSAGTTFLVINGPNLNSYGDSKLNKSDAAQQALLRSMIRSLPEKKESICENHSNFLEEC